MTDKDQDTATVATALGTITDAPPRDAPTEASTEAPTFAVSSSTLINWRTGEHFRQDRATLHLAHV